MSNILIVYSTVDGHTRHISEHLAGLLRTSGHEAQLLSVVDVSSDELADCDKVIIGASIRYGNYRPELEEFVREKAALLGSKPSAFFSVNLVARKPGRDTPATNPYISKLLNRTTWRPDVIGIFAGKLDYSRYRPIDRYMVRLIMWLMGGPKQTGVVQEYTNWDRVSEFAMQINLL